MHKIYFYSRLLCLVVLLSFIFTSKAASLKIAISHCNDINGQVGTFRLGTHETLKPPQQCSQITCVGGLRNVVHWMFEKKDFGFENISEENTFRFSSGNIIGGENGWLGALGGTLQENWKSYAGVIRDNLNLDGMALGPKEFGVNLDTTLQFLNETTRNNSFVSIANTCDIIHDNYTILERTFCDAIGLPVKKLVVRENDSGSNYTIGVLGFANPLAERLALPGRLVFTDVAQALQAATEAYSDINFFIAIGDGNLDLAKSIMDRVSKVKLVIFSSAFSSTPNMTGNYPVPYQQGFIATAGRYGSSVGKLVLEIDTETHNVVSTNGRLVTTAHPGIYNDQASDRELLYTLSGWRAAILRKQQDQISRSSVDLIGGENCLRQECNLGNLVTDAIVHCVHKTLPLPFPFPLHAIWHAGALANDRDFNSGRITEFDVSYLLPYSNYAHLVSVLGKDLRRIFETSANAITNQTDGGQLLQVSNGLQVQYAGCDDSFILSKLRIRHMEEDFVPTMKDVDNNLEYYLVIPTYLYEGRGIYSFAAHIWRDVPEQYKQMSKLDQDCLEEYIRAFKQIAIGIEDRIVLN